jgi:hypothetical protein
MRKAKYKSRQHNIHGKPTKGMKALSRTKLTLTKASNHKCK